MKKRKGFTLVELLVVIAILAILATVSIVGYTSFLKKANESNAVTELTQVKELFIAQDITDDYLKINSNGLTIKNESDEYVKVNNPVKGNVGKYYVISTSKVKTTDTAIVSGKTYYEKGTGDEYTAVETPVVADIGNYYEETTGYAPAPETFDSSATYYRKKGYETLGLLVAEMVDDLGEEVASKIYAAGGTTIQYVYYVYDDAIAQWDTATGDVEIVIQSNGNQVYTTK